MIKCTRCGSWSGYGAICGCWFKPPETTFKMSFRTSAEDELEKENKELQKEIADLKLENIRLKSKLETRDATIKKLSERCNNQREALASFNRELEGSGNKRKVRELQKEIERLEDTIKELKRNVEIWQNHAQSTLHQREAVKKLESLGYQYDARACEWERKPTLAEVLDIPSSFYIGKDEPPSISLLTCEQCEEVVNACNEQLEAQHKEIKEWKHIAKQHEECVKKMEHALKEIMNIADGGL